MYEQIVITPEQARTFGRILRPHPREQNRQQTCRYCGKPIVSASRKCFYCGRTQ